MNGVIIINYLVDTNAWSLIKAITVCSCRPYHKANTKHDSCLRLLKGASSLLVLCVPVNPPARSLGRLRCGLPTHMLNFLPISEAFFSYSIAAIVYIASNSHFHSHFQYIFVRNSHPFFIC